MSIVLTLRDGKLMIPKEYYKRYLELDWFFSKMIEFDSMDNDNEYTLWEDKNAILSIFDSLKFSKLVVHDGVSIDYLENLCDMWLVPDWIKSALQDRKREMEEEAQIKVDNISKKAHIEEDNISREVHIEIRDIEVIASMENTIIIEENVIIIEENVIIIKKNIIIIEENVIIIK